MVIDGPNACPHCKRPPNEFHCQSLTCPWFTCVNCPSTYAKYQIPKHVGITSITIIFDNAGRFYTRSV